MGVARGVVAPKLGPATPENLRAQCRTRSRCDRLKGSLRNNRKPSHELVMIVYASLQGGWAEWHLLKEALNNPM